MNKEDRKQMNAKKNTYRMIGTDKSNKTISVQQLFQYLSASNLPVSNQFRKNYSLKQLTTVKTGGNAELFFAPHSIMSLKTVFKYICENKIKYHVLGNGSNLLISDKGVDGVVISLKNLPRIFECKKDFVSVSANLKNKEFVKNLIQNGISGLEFLNGIPGTVGGMLRMNAGAFDRSITEKVNAILFIDSNGEMQKFYAEQYESDYRDLKLKNKDYVIISAEFQLEISSSKLVKQSCDEFMKMRNSKAIIHLPTFGSTFKNGENYFAGELIDKCDLKGYSIGQAQISEKHANFIINSGNAKSIDIYHLMKYAQKKVAEKFGINLMSEVKLWGSFNDE
ncbi:MAG: UDP-N-acetylmuramate dehydrogenase [Candidatus Cloacimonadota bacterium]|nr:UDP-N-acetylmuramate dehydrogenase [Candidatus Cloacimonadota bacterium]